MGFLTNRLIYTLLRFQTRAVCRNGFDLDAWRAYMAGLGRTAWVPRGVRMEPAEIDGLSATWVRPPEGTGRQVLYLHGGMFVGGAAADYRELIGRIAVASGADVLALDYRLAPEHPFPAAVEDARRALAWLNQVGSPPIIAGDSAGAALALAALRGGGAAAGCVLLSPWVDLTLGGSSLIERRERDPLLAPEALAAAAALYLGQASPHHVDASPLFADLSGLPPTLIHVGTEEVLHDDARRLAAAVREAGVEVEFASWEGMVHDFQMAAALLAEGRASIAQIGAFIRSRP